MPELQESSGGWCAGSHVAEKILIGAKENKTAWAEVRGRASHIAHLFGAHPLPALPTASCLLSVSFVPPPRALQLWSHLCLIMETLPCALQTPPTVSHPFADKALLPLPVTHGFLF